jgi:hypothetical protein
MRPPGQMNEPFSISCCRQRSGGVQTNCEKLLLDSRSGRCACATRILRTDVGRCPDAPLPTSNTYCYPGALPFGQIDVACRVGARRIIFLVEPWAFSRQYRYPEALMDTADCPDGFDRRLFCRQLELRFGISGQEIYLLSLRVECRIVGISLDGFHIERKHTFICAKSRSALAIVCVAWVVRFSLSGRTTLIQCNPQDDYSTPASWRALSHWTANCSS